MEFIFILVSSFIFSLLFIAPLSATIARNKGLKTHYWFLAGLFFGPLGLLAVCGMPDKILRRQVSRLLETHEELLEEFIAFSEPDQSKYIETIEEPKD
tara:strand:+ start:320 stop:613 length:294 start_codon:yes stop_codon:yes gene_type:complete